MPTAKPLSPAAQAVNDAARDAWANNMDDPRAIAAVALRAAADPTISSLIGDICHPKYLEGCEAASAFVGLNLGILATLAMVALHTQRR